MAAAAKMAAAADDKAKVDKAATEETWLVSDGRFSLSHALYSCISSDHPMPPHIPAKVLSSRPHLNTYTLAQVSSSMPPYHDPLYSLA